MSGTVLPLRDDPDDTMTAAEHLEEVARLMGWNVGAWQVEVVLRDGHVEKAYPRRGAIGRNELHDRRRDLTESDL